ncbi:GTP cyclohydrolase 1 type 2/Nif3 [Coemansia spiralis]|nr:GTP cyclohydrolase 1 type 2/Nif3 [Coemansia spiralis]
MSRCKICSKEYSKGSSTGTLKRHFRQHQINVGSGNSYSRPSPPTTGGTGNNATHHVSRPRAYSHRTESRTRREVSPFSSPPAARSLARFVAMPPHTSAAPAAAGVSSLSSSSSSSALASSAMVSAPVAPGMVVGKQGQPAASAGMRVSTASDMDTSSAIAGSALLSMAAGDQRMAVDGESIRRPARSSDPSVYPHQDGTSPDVSMVDPETRDISVSPSPSTATSAHENMLAETGGIKGFGFSESDRNAMFGSDAGIAKAAEAGLRRSRHQLYEQQQQQQQRQQQQQQQQQQRPLSHPESGADVEGQVEGADSYAEYDSDDGGRRHPHKRRRATVTSVQSASSGEFLREGDPLSATELVALSSELMLRVAHALPLLAQEAAATAAVAAASKTENGDEAGGGHPDSQRRASLLCGSNGDPLDLLFGHIKNTLLDRSGLQNGTTAVPSSSSAAATSHPSPHATKAQQLLSSSVSPSSALSNFYNILSIPFLNRDSHQTTTASSALPYTVRKAFPFSAQTRQQPVTHTKASAESSSLYDMSLLSRVSAAMQRIAPLSLAELKWDNVGILLEAAQPRANASKVFLTIDLTLETLNEALDDPAVGVIVSYHPPIFFAWKSLTMSDHKQSLILKCAGAGVSIYSPHTSLDSCENGINDWLASLAGEGKVTPITPALPESADGQQNAGSGRIVELASPQPLTSIVSRVKNLLELERIRVARASCHESDDDKQKLISTVAVCAGAGNSVVGSVPADLYITGEMGHHEVLAAVAKGTSCILGEHSNTERGYLRTILVKRLQQELDSDKADETTSIIVSKHDKDPISIE